MAGDSLTYGQGDTEVFGYRKTLTEWLKVTQGIDCYNVGSFTNGGLFTNNNHNGAPSATSTTLSAAFPSFALSSQRSDVAIIMIGTGDTNAGATPAFDPVLTPQRIRGLWEAYLVSWPMLKALLILNIPHNPYDFNVTVLNAALPAQASIFAQAHPDIAVYGPVDIFNAVGPYTPETYVDGTHFSAAGYALEAAAIIDAIQNAPRVT